MEAISKALLTLHENLALVSQDWMLIGTTSLFLQGYPVIPKDIDVLCSGSAAPQLKDALKCYVDGDLFISKSEKFRSDFGRFRIGEVIVEVMGGLEVNTSTGWINLWDTIVQKVIVRFKGANFLVPSGSEQLKIYQLFGRKKDQAILNLLTAST